MGRPALIRGIGDWTPKPESATRNPPVRAAQLLSEAEQQLRAAGADGPRLTALILLEHTTGLSREHLVAYPDTAVPPVQAAHFWRLIARRCQREPLAYITGHWEFFGRPFRVTPATLIPRPETEGLVELAIDRLRKLRQGHNHLIVLDVGTGSGAIAVTLLVEVAGLQAVATDVDPAAITVAAKNARQHSVADRLHLVVTDLAGGLRGPFPVVVANLPYVPTAHIDGLQPEIARYEPRAALDGGADGTTQIRRLLDALPGLVAPGGCALLEIGEGQGPLLTDYVKSSLAGFRAMVRPDWAHAERYLVVKRDT